VDPDKIQVIYNSVEIEKVEELSKEPVTHPFFEERKKGAFLIVTAGRLTKQKSQDILLKAFSLVKEKISAYLLILGKGDLEKELKDLTIEMGLENFVDFVGFKDNLFKWIASSDVFVLSSSWEGFGNVIIEAMASRAPPFIPLNINVCNTIETTNKLNKITVFNKILDRFNLSISKDGFIKILHIEPTNNVIAAGCTLTFPKPDTTSVPERNGSISPGTSTVASINAIIIIAGTQILKNPRSTAKKVTTHMVLTETDKINTENSIAVITVTPIVVICFIPNPCLEMLL